MPCYGTKSLERRSAWGPSVARRGAWTIASGETKSSREACESVVTRLEWDIRKPAWVGEGRRVDELCERVAHLGPCSVSGIAGDLGNLASKGASQQQEPRTGATITHWSGRGTDVSVHGPENAWPLSGARGLGFIALTIQPGASGQQALLICSPPRLPPGSPRALQTDAKMQSL